MRVLALVAVLALAGCGWSGTGTVIDRDYDDPDTRTTTTTKCDTRTVRSSDGKTTTTRKTNCRPRTSTVREPASWSLLVKDDKDGGEHWVSVNQHQYSTHPEGTKYTND